MIADKQRKALVKKQRKSLKLIAEKIQSMALDWEDVDQYNVNVLEELSNQTLKLADDLMEVE